MQIQRIAAWGQMDFAPEAGNLRTPKVPADPQNNPTIQKENPPADTPDEASQKETKNRGGLTDEQMLSYFNMLKNNHTNTNRQHQVQDDELKALRIAHNIMRGKKVPAKDESFLLSKNFKMYMAAKNVASMIECKGTAKSELGNDKASPAANSADGSSASSVVSESLSDASTTCFTADGLNDITASTNSVTAFSSELSKTEDYSTLIEGMKSGDGINRSFSVSQTSARKKKRQRFHYNFKEISSRITSAKTSGNARQAFSQARQRTVSLRQKLKSGQYDEEAVQLALIHAEAMERVAKKKMKHLQEEEAAKKTGGICAGDIDQEMQKEQQLEDEQLFREMQAGGSSANTAIPTASGDGVFSEDASLEELMQDAIQVSFSELAGDMEELMENFTDLMDDTLEEVLNVSELAEEMLSGGGKTQDPAELDEMKRKHRTEEQRAIAEADSKYLKAFFNKLQREQRAIASGASKIAAAMNSSGGMLISAPAAAAAARTPAAPSKTTAEPAGGGAAPTATDSITPVGNASAPFAEASVSIELPVSAEGGTIDISI